MKSNCGGENKLYFYNEIIDVLQEHFQNVKPIKTNKKIDYYNFPCTFDIETSSFMQENEKKSIMYIWTFCINGYVFYGRSWSDFDYLYNNLIDFFNLTEDKRLVIYIHNLAFEFQYLRKLYDWKSVFSLKSRKPIYAITKQGIEFRCSYLLSGYSLETIGDNLRIYKIKKLIGDLDYSLIRHKSTIITNEEIKYCINDVLVLACYIQEKIEIDGNITKIPLTKTGYVRNLCRKNCYYDLQEKNNNKYHKYRSFISDLTLTYEEYTYLKNAFSGGFTHANAMYVGDILKNVDSFDFTSSYPYVMISELFPMSKADYTYPKDKKQFNEWLENYCCLFQVEFINIKASFKYDNYISESHCEELEEKVVNNGRVVKAKHLKIWVTELDYKIIKRTYDFEDCIIIKFIKYEKAYLPTDLVKTILKLYVDKTELKGIVEKEDEYLSSKEQVNSCYGMMVMDIVRDEIIYNGDEQQEWSKLDQNAEHLIDKYNKSKNRFLYYPWGIWVTAYARYNLWTGILEFGEDYIYSDTDSIKCINAKNHMEYINNYNKIVRQKLELACKKHNIDTYMTRPKTIKGVEKELGIWEWETKSNNYSRFKTLGAKRYMFEEDNEIYITIAGLKKKTFKTKQLGLKTAVDYMEQLGDPFEVFNNDLYIPPEYTGKLTHTYIDEEIIGTITDYNGKIDNYNELSGIYLEQASYNLSLSESFIDYLFGISNKPDSDNIFKSNLD